MIYEGINKEKGSPLHLHSLTGELASLQNSNVRDGRNSAGITLDINSVHLSLKINDYTLISWKLVLVER